MDRLKFDPIFGDFSSFFLNKVFHQNKKTNVKKTKSEKLISRNILLKQNFQECLLWIAGNELHQW